MSASAPGPGLHLDAAGWRVLLERLGPSLALWRAAEVAVLRSVAMPRPILDVGCGDGLVTSLALPRIDIGLDPDPSGLAKAARSGAYVRVVEGAAERCPLPPGSVATVLANSVFEHLEHLDAALAALAQALRGGGLMVITTPSDAFSHWLAAPVPGYAAARNRKLIHRNLLTLTEWEARLRAVGLTIERTQPYLRRRLVCAWDMLDQVESVWVARRRVAGLLWKRIPPAGFARLARFAAAVELSSRQRGGGLLIVARKDE